MQQLITYLVEDNPTILSSLVEALGEIAHLKVTAHSDTQTEANRWLERHHVDWHLVIVDLFLRQGTGLGVLAACRERQPYQKVVLLTNYATAEIRLRSASLGADAVFDKSTELDALMEYCMEQARNLSQAPVQQAQREARARQALPN